MVNVLFVVRFPDNDPSFKPSFPLCLWCSVSFGCSRVRKCCERIDFKVHRLWFHSLIAWQISRAFVAGLMFWCIGHSGSISSVRGSALHTSHLWCFFCWRLMLAISHWHTIFLRLCSLPRHLYPSEWADSEEEAFACYLEHNALFSAIRACEAAVAWDSHAFGCMFSLGWFGSDLILKIHC